jgi:Response regulator receiver domain/Histidine kinase-, DNA gyrase B-, and HSP90-like ATPase
MIAVTDTGSGMTQEVLAKAFEPFFTTKETGKGSGLGLSQVLGFAKQTGGGMRIDTRVGEGTSIKVYLPRALQDSASLAPVAMVGVASGNRRSATILLVDDDSAVREVTASMLEGLGYVVLTVGSGGGALDLLERHTKVDLVLLDFAMPVMNGAWSSRARSSRNAPRSQYCSLPDTSTKPPWGNSATIKSSESLSLATSSRRKLTPRCPNASRA